NLTFRLNITHELFHHFDGFAPRDPKVKVGVVRFIRIPTHGGNRASKKGLCLAARTFGFNPAYTVQITETVNVKIEVVGSLSGSGRHDGELQKNGLEEHAPTQEPNGLDRESEFPVRVAKKKMYSGTVLRDQYVRLSRVETPLW